MRRMIMLMALMGAVVVDAAPAGADPVEKSAYFVAECAVEGNPQSVERMWFPTEDSVRIRHATNVYDEYLYTGSDWVGPFAQNTTVANVNAAFPSFEGNFWGTWTFHDYGTVPGFDDMEGTWVFTENGAAKASGKTDDGRVVKVTLGLENPAPPFDGCEVAEFVIFNK